MTQTWGRPAIQGGADFVHDSGLCVETWASNVSGNQYAGGSMESDLYGGYSYQISDDFTVGARLYYYCYPGTNNTDFYKHAVSLANSDVRNLGGSGGYVTVGPTF